jgi:hypothetical protein
VAHCRHDALQTAAPRVLPVLLGVGRGAGQGVSGGRQVSRPCRHECARRSRPMEANGRRGAPPWMRPVPAVAGPARLLCTRLLCCTRGPRTPRPSLSLPQASARATRRGVTSCDPTKTTINLPPATRLPPKTIRKPPYWAHCSVQATGHPFNGSTSQPVDRSNPAHRDPALHLEHHLYARVRLVHAAHVLNEVVLEGGVCGGGGW